MSPELIETPESFHRLMDRITDAPVVALDTEAASFHRYHDRIYLIQLSTPDLTAVIDPLTVGDLAPIGTLLGRADVQKVFHDADYDLRLFDHELGFHARNLFDTRIAAQFLNEPGIGLAALLEKYFGVRPDKRFQRADWSVRPLSAPMIEYAAGDTENLCGLRDILLQMTVEIGRLSWVEEEFTRTEKTRWTAGDPDPLTDFMHMKGARTLERRGLAVLRELYNWRTGVADELDRAEFRIVGNETLLHLAAHPVTASAQLAQVRGLSREIGERRGGELLAAMGRGLTVPESELPRFPRPPRRTPDPAYEARVEALKKERNTQAQRLELAPGVLCPNGTLEAVAALQPASLDQMATIESVRRWQLETIGAALLSAMQGAAPAASTEAE